MTQKLISTCDRSLMEAFGALELIRFARGVYAQSDDDVIWRGIWVTFNIRMGALIAQPNVSVFCPSAQKLVSDGLEELHGHTQRSYFGKLGDPVLTRPLYNLVRSILGENRMPTAYHVAGVEQINEVTTLMRNDFTRAGRPFLDQIDSMPKLREQLMTDGATGAHMYAIALMYLVNRRIASNEIDRVLGPKPNAMAREFAQYFKKRFARE